MFPCSVLFSHKLYLCAVAHPLVSNKTKQEPFFLSIVTGMRVFSIFPRIYWGPIKGRFPSPHAQWETRTATPGPGNKDFPVHRGHSLGIRGTHLLSSRMKLGNKKGNIQAFTDTLHCAPSRLIAALVHHQGLPTRS